MKDVEKKELSDQLGVGRGREKKHHQLSQTSFPQYNFIYFFC